MTGGPAPTRPRTGRDITTRVLRNGYASVLRPMLFRVHGGDAEAAHELTLRSLSLVARVPPAVAVLGALVGRPADPVRFAGIEMPGRVGLAAGVDKNGIALAGWPGFGFGFVEVGTVTFRPQPGNPPPRMFRLPASQAVINRMGFNNLGAESLARRLRAAGVWRGSSRLPIPVGVSIGKSKVSPLTEAVDDYLASFRLVAPHADYVAINVSSPNTPGLRKLQDKGLLTELVRALVAEAATDVGNGPMPILIKVATDLTDAALDELLTVCVTEGVAGVIATNTTVGRAGLVDADRALAAEAGGLSGAPLTARSLAVVDHVVRRSGLPVIGVGGIMTAEHARAMFDAGAALVQLCTGFVYRGPALVRAINRLPTRETR